jgi:hypothetical protein
MAHGFSPINKILCNSVLAALICGTGCNAILGKDAFAPASIPQSEEVVYTAPFKMKIIRVHWQNVGNSGAGSTLAVDLTLTNTGDSPFKPSMPPMFELKDSAGRHFAPRTPNDFTQGIVLGGPINPGANRSNTIFFDVPTGNYELYVFYGVWSGGWNLSKSGTAIVWTLSPLPQ